MNRPEGRRWALDLTDPEVRHHLSGTREGRRALEAFERSQVPGLSAATRRALRRAAQRIAEREWHRQRHQP